MSLFDVPVTDWTGGQLAAGVIAVTESRNGAVLRGQDEVAQALTNVLVVLCGQIEQRKALGDAVDEAMSPFTTLWSGIEPEPDTASG